jgi:hypothetical protein
VEGHLIVFASAWTSPDWIDSWQPLGCQMCRFVDHGLDSAMPDSQVWQFCQDQASVLITGNRNDNGPESLEATMQRLNTP